MQALFLFGLAGINRYFWNTNLNQLSLHISSTNNMHMDTMHSIIIHTYVMRLYIGPHIMQSITNVANVLTCMYVNVCVI